MRQNEAKKKSEQPYADKDIGTRWNYRRGEAWKEVERKEGRRESIDWV